MKKTIILALSATFMFHAVMAQKAPDPKDKQLSVYETETPPMIDGKMDDPCWKNAAKTDSFHVFKSAKAPKESTEVLVTYDARNLYLFVICHESRMDKLRATRPQDSQDEKVFTDDSFEVFLEPVEPKEGVNHFQFAINSLATRFDMAHPTSKWSAGAYTGVWQVKCGRQEKAWTAEFAITFYSLTHLDEFRCTPILGEKWRVNFCRSEQRLPEWSTWSFQDRGFHDRSRFGYMTFMGPRDKKLPCMTVTNPGQLKLGPSAIQGTVRNPTGSEIDLQLKLSISNADQKKRLISTNKIVVAADKERHFEIPYLITAEGSSRLFLELCSDKTPLSIGSVPFDTPNLGEILKKCAENLKTVEATLKKLSGDMVERLGGQWGGINKRRQELQSVYENRKTLRPDQWQTMEKDILGLRESAETFERLVSKALLKANADSLTPGFPVGMTVVDSFHKIKPDAVFLSSNKQISLSAARGETESFQVVLQAGDAGLKDMKVVPGDLKRIDGKGEIGKENIHWGAVGVIKRKLPKKGQTETGFSYHPDPVMSERPFALEPNELRSVWMDVYVPETTKAGDYKGKCEVLTNDGMRLPVEIALRVYDFTLPKLNSLRVEDWYNPQNVIYYYRQKDLPLEQFEKHAEMLSRYRYPCFPFSWQFAPKKVLVIEEPDGSLSFDFTELNKYLAISRKYGCRLGNIQMAPLLGWVQALSGTFGRPYFKILNRETGEIRDYPKRDDRSRKMEYEEIAHSYLHQELLKALWKNIKDHGWEDMIYSEHEDEPNDPVRFERYRRMAVLIKELCPGIKTTSWGVSPGDRRGTIGYSNCWGPNANHLEKRDMAAIRERRKEGEETWVYTCGPTSPDPSTGREVYDNAVDSPIIKNRIGPLTCWQLGLQGFFHFAITGFDAAMVKGLSWNGEKVPEEKQFHNVELPKFDLGIGMYVWPAPDGSLWPSIRLAAMRDGLEDYEYLAELKRKLDRLKVLDADNLLIEKYEPLLDLAPTVVQDEGRWTHDSGILSQRRENVAKAIESLNPVLRQLSPTLMGKPGENRKGKER